MKRLIFLINITVLAVASSFAQTKVIKVNALKTNDYGVRYTLPKTQLKVDIEYSETIQQAGTYAKYASRYLGVKDEKVIFEDQTLYTLDNVTVTTTGVPNKEQSYLISFKTKTTSPFVYLTEDGMICSINAEYIPENQPVKNEFQAETATEITIQPQSIYTEEYLRAGSISKMAEVAAKNIFTIRENRQDILTGEIENMPKDGDALKIVLGNLEAQEKLWTELFTGTAQIVKRTKQITVEPVTEVNHEVLFRFSKYAGVVDTDDLSGNPVYWNLTDLKTVDIPESDAKKKAKEPQSIVYNIPGKANLELYFGNQTLLSETIDITQFGTTELLTPSLFEDKKTQVKIYFYPYLGAVKEIVQ
ncbi:MAG: DUF4831 family protein [Candidatus Symbiothrix sp.]|jgi:hypothetical protein|nr:DUF4831 family protein [Candidatus Symbiothrix sp.]